MGTKAAANLGKFKWPTEGKRNFAEKIPIELRRDGSLDQTEVQATITYNFNIGDKHVDE